MHQQFVSAIVVSQAQAQLQVTLAQQREVERTRAKYIEAYEVLTDEAFSDWYGNDD